MKGPRSQKVLRGMKRRAHFILSAVIPYYNEEFKHMGMRGSFLHVTRMTLVSAGDIL